LKSEQNIRKDVKTNSKKSNIVINVYPAKNGDCFLVNFETKNNKQIHVLIDCGFVDTFNTYLKDDLLKISGKGGCLAKLILTHIDADHIQGAIRFLKDNNSEGFIKIQEIWHNTFRHLFEKGKDEIDKKQKLILQRIIKRGYPKKEHKQGEQAISAEQGTTVGALILEGNYSWNSDFESKAVCIENKKRILIGQDSSIYLLSPNKDKLNKLKELWEKELKKYGVNYSSDSSKLYDDAFEMLLAWEKEKVSKVPKQISSVRGSLTELIKKPFDEDKTSTNGSSIAFILTIQNKRLLFLADSHPSLIVKSLQEFQKEKKVYFDLIKISHHGSFNNINQELLDKIDSDKYLISTDGSRHNHPNKETIAHIIYRKTDFRRKLYFNYVTTNSEYFNRTDWMEKYNYSILYLNQAPFTLEL